MNKTILFSPVGGTDPMSEKNCYDGAMLHICRHYRPDTVFLYMSKEIVKKQEKDDRYRKCIHWLGEKLQHTFEIKTLEHPELVEVQLFDPIYHAFEMELEKIVDSMDSSDNLLINISSGTPAMKSALLVLATMIDLPCECLQVDTPEGGMNEHEHRDEDIEALWELNPDNGQEIENVYMEQYGRKHRIHAEKLVSLKRLKYEETIKKYIGTYDYHSATMLAEEMKVEPNTLYYQKLKIAEARQALNLHAADYLLANHDRSIYSPIVSEKAREPFEYMLDLQAKVYRKEYAAFLRGLSPILTNLFGAILVKHTGFDYHNYARTDRPHLWDMRKLVTHEQAYQCLMQVYQGRSNVGFTGGMISNDHLQNLIEGLITDEKIRTCARKLRIVESRCRNEAAHTVVYISEKRIIERIKDESDGSGACTQVNSCNDILKLLREAFTYTSYGVKSEMWKSYDRMNEDIISVM